MNIFNQIQIKKPKSNRFDLSHERKLSFNMGELVPIMLEEIVPGDRFKVNSEIMIRLAPMLAPIMHRVNVYTHYFFVPNRIVWDNWKSFITGGEDGTEAPTFPYISQGSGTQDALFFAGTLADYFGLPLLPSTGPYQARNISALPFRAYQEIYNEYYRDQNLEEKIPFSKGDGAQPGGDYPALLTLRTRAWEKDYFTSALPWAQRGGEVLLPVTGTGTPTYRSASDYLTSDGSPVAAGAATFDSGSNLTDGASDPTRVENIQDIDMTGTSVTINELRTASRLQEWLEKNARAGSRYIEQILSHFGVRSSDARLQRPEYLGGGKSPVVISEVLNTTGEADPTQPVDYAPVGQQYGHGVSVGKTNGFGRFFEEHGYVIGIMSVLPRTGYMQGTERTWKKFDKLDYFWPEFGHLGEQEINQDEIYTDFLNPESEEVFGYIPRYAEYKYKQSSVHGDFRKTDTGDNLSYWHMARWFETKPVLNDAFVKSDPTERIFAVQDNNATDKLYCQVFNRISAIRPMPYFGTPYL